MSYFVETPELGQLDLRTLHHPCGAAHCAWGEVTGLSPRPEDDENDAVWANEMISAKDGRSKILGLTDVQFRSCFGMGYQFRHLGRPYAPADVAQRLRETAAALEGDKTRP